MVAFLAAGVIFVATIGVVLFVSRTGPSNDAVSDSQRTGGLGVEAANLANVVAGTAGYGSQPGGPTSQNDWINNPDGLTRLGLRDAANPGQFSYDKFDNLRRAGLLANASDGLVNYPEALASLGLDQAGLGFHLRAWPDLSKVQRDLDAGVRFDAGLRLAYLAHMQDFHDQQSLGTGAFTIRLCVMVLDITGAPTTLGHVDLGAVIHLAGGMTPDEPVYAQAMRLPGFNLTNEQPLNADLDGDGVNDAICTNYNGLTVTPSGYTYGQVTLTGSTIPWVIATYNDYVSGTFSTTNFYPYSGEMFDGNANNNAGRNTNADGHIMLTAGKPVREMVVRLVPAGGTCGAYCGGGGGGIDPGLTMAPDPTCTAATIDGIKTYTVGTTIRNDGTSTTQFWAAIKLTTPGGLTLSQNTNTLLVAPGATVLLQAIIPAYQAYCPAGTQLSVTVYDPNMKLVTLTATTPSGVTPPAGTTPPFALYVDTYAKAYFLASETPKLTFGGAGLSASNPAKIRLQVWSGSGVGGTKYYDTTFSNVQATTTFSLPASTVLAPGPYVVRVCAYASNSADCATATKKAEATENFIVATVPPLAFVPNNAVPPPPNSYPFVPSAEAVTETALLEAMFQGFCPYYYDSASFSAMQAPVYHPRCDALSGPHAGSVYPDVQGTLNDDLSAILAVEPDPTHPGALRPQYLDVLIVGSDVDHTAMSKPAAQEAVKQWVLAGGHLVVFGSTAQDVNWLAPIFASGIASSSGGLYTPDLDHPLLHTPYALDYVTYAAPPNAWQLDPSAQAHFTNVVVDGAGNAILTVSDPAAFGQGRVVLTGWLPFNVLGHSGAAQTVEAKHLIANLVLLSLQNLFLDYGPHIPPGVNVIPASRLALIPQPGLGLVPVTVVVYVFPTG